MRKPMAPASIHGLPAANHHLAFPYSPPPTETQSEEIPGRVQRLRPPGPGIPAARPERRTALGARTMIATLWPTDLFPLFPDRDQFQCDCGQTASHCCPRYGPLRPGAPRLTRCCQCSRIPPNPSINSAVSLDSSDSGRLYWIEPPGVKQGISSAAGRRALTPGTPVQIRRPFPAG